MAKPHIERVTVFWPRGPYDFVLTDWFTEPTPVAGWEDWVIIHGRCVWPEGIEHRAWRSFYVHPVEHGFALLPMIKG